MGERVSLLRTHYELLLKYQKLANIFLGRRDDLSKKGKTLVEGFTNWMDKNPAKTTILTIDGIREMGEYFYSDKIESLVEAIRKEEIQCNEEYDDEKQAKREETYNNAVSEFREKTLQCPFPEIKEYMTDELTERWDTAGSYVFRQMGVPTFERLYAHGVKTPADLANYTAEELAKFSRKTPKSTLNKPAMRKLAELYGITLKSEQQEATNDN